MPKLLKKQSATSLCRAVESALELRPQLCPCLRVENNLQLKTSSDT
jgi:hypothetical protein